MTYRFKQIIASMALSTLVLGGMTACSGKDERDIIAASPTAITVTSTRFTEPTRIAETHCKKFGRKAVSRGGVKLGSPAYKIMWGFDCVDP